MKLFKYRKVSFLTALLALCLVNCTKETDDKHTPGKSTPPVPIDTLQRLESITTTYSGRADIDSIIYLYNDTGRMIGVHYLRNSDTTQIINNFIYDDENRLIRIDFWKDWGGGFFGKCAWTFSSKGQLISLDSNQLSDTRSLVEYSYSEENNFLESITHRIDGGPVYSPVNFYYIAYWEFVKKWDSNGNPTEIVHSKHPRANEVDSIYWRTYFLEYNAGNQLTKKISYYDTLLVETETYDYEANGYLVKYTHDYSNPNQTDYYFEHSEHNVLGKPEVIKRVNYQDGTIYRKYVFEDIILYK